MIRSVVLAACGVALAAPALAQGRQAAAARPDPQVAARYQMAIMEDVLERAVQRGARMMGQQLQGGMPQMLLIGGNARARGFRLEGYGVFFDVDVPAMRQSVVWSWRTLELDNKGGIAAIEALKTHLKTVTDPAQRRELDQAIRQLELQVAPFSSAADAEKSVRRTGSDPRSTAVSVPAPAPVAHATVGGVPALAGVPPGATGIEDPNAAYTSTVSEALIDAMLVYSQGLSIAPDEWLTVAARDRGESGVSTDDPFDATTIQIRIKGADLLSFHAGRLTRDEARKRVDVREY
jgi:hypothetical protein